MTHRFYTRAVSFFLVFGLLLTGLSLPVFAVPASDTNNSSNISIPNDELLATDEFSSQADEDGITSQYVADITDESESTSLTASTGPIRLDCISRAVQEGNRRTLTATTEPADQTVTWSTSNSSIATVSSTGVVTGIKAGTAIITATMVDANDITHTASCTVYVYIANGVYYMQNVLSAFHLTAPTGQITGLPIVYQFVRYPNTTNINHRIHQMWKIRYLSEGRYSIRPMSKLDMALYVTGNNVNLYNVGANDTLATLSTSAKWSIEWDSDGYVFKIDGSDESTLQIQHASPTSGIKAIADTYSSSNMSCKWDLEKISNPPAGALIYDTTTTSIASDEIRYVAPNQTRSLSSFGLVPAFYSDSSISQTFEWFSSDTAIATVDSETGAVTGVSPGTVTITGRKYYSFDYYYVSYTLVVTEIPEGTYFLKNKQTGAYADIKNQTMAAGTTIQQWEFNGGDSQRWIFTLLDDGYYTIKSNNSSGAYYMGVINDSSGLDVDIVLRTGTITDGMKWKIELTANGAYKVIPKTGEANGYVLATSTSSASNGYKLIQGDYLDNSSYRDEWLLDPYSAVFYGVTNAGHDHISSLSAISNTMINENWNEVTVRSGVIPSSVCKADLLSTTVFTSRSHGQLITYSITGNTASTGIILNDADENANYIAFYSHSWSSMSSGSTYIYSNEDYTGLVLALFIGCSTASGGENGRNLPATIVKHGAIAAVGFSESIGCSAANTWTRYFYQKMLQGATLEEAVNFACSNVPETSGLHSVVICGDSTLKLPIN